MARLVIMLPPLRTGPEHPSSPMCQHFIIMAPITLQGFENIDRIFSSANSVEIIFFIANNPMCKKSDIYQYVTRNAHTNEKIGRLVEEGLIQVHPTNHRNMTLLSLTDKGMLVYNILMQAEELLRGPAEDDPEDDMETSSV